MANMKHQSSILYQNQDKTVTLIDIPTSISIAQGIENSPNHAKLLSSDPLQQPYQSTEPKSEKALANLLQRPKSKLFDEELFSLYADVVKAALSDIRAQRSGPWCLPRKLGNLEPFRKRKAREMSSDQSPTKTSSTNVTAAIGTDAQTSTEKVEDPSDALCSVFSNFLSQTHTLEVHVSEVTTSEPTILESPEDTEILEVLEQWDGCFHNMDDAPLRMMIAESREETVLKSFLTQTMPQADEKVHQPFSFLVPPLSTFLLGDCTKSSDFRSMVRSFSENYQLGRRFDFILLDPPWSNASVQRKGSYKTGNWLKETKELLLSMDLDQYIAPNGLVGVWITNRPAVRNMVIGPGGLFESMNVGLAEEWIWIKTTINGEPVTEIDGLWRKPYEVLLLGKAPETRILMAQNATNVRRRVIAGVPDLHSRKPCLKELVKDFLPSKYQALEIFARYLVAGWFSWGDEVLKFNWDGYWSREDEEGDDMMEVGHAELQPSAL
jgi:N6-adenosine-specific RNA methylase IME4